MRILVVESDDLQQQAAREQLSDHELTIARDFIGAMWVMAERVDEEAFRRILPESEIPVSFDWTSSSDFLFGDALAKKIGAMEPFPFDVVLTNMMVRRGGGRYDKDGSRNESGPFGFPIVLRAALRGAKFVAMVSGMDFERNYFSRYITRLGTPLPVGDDNRYKPSFVINGATTMFVFAALTAESSREVRRIDWARILRDLTTIKVEENREPNSRAPG